MSRTTILPVASAVLAGVVDWAVLGVLGVPSLWVAVTVLVAAAAALVVVQRAMDGSAMSEKSMGIRITNSKGIRTGRNDIAGFDVGISDDGGEDNTHEDNRIRGKDEDEDQG